MFADRPMELALETSAKSVSAAVTENGAVLASANQNRGPRLCAIGDTEELTQALSGLLSAETEPGTRKETRRQAETQGLDYAHAAVLSLRAEPEDLTTASGTPVTCRGASGRSIGY